MTGHTKEKWTATESEGMGMWQVDRGAHLVAGYIDTEAEARLIAASPALLEALQEARAHIEGSGFGAQHQEGSRDALIARIDAAIAAATGRET